MKPEPGNSDSKSDSKSDGDERSLADQMRALRKEVRTLRIIVTVAVSFFLLRMFLEGLGELFKHFR